MMVSSVSDVNFCLQMYGCYMMMLRTETVCVSLHRKQHQLHFIS